MQASDKKKFKITMVDDEPHSMDDEIDEIKIYLKNKYDLELNIKRCKKAADGLNAIDQTTDIAFIDKNLNGTNGIEVINNIRNKHKLLDILIYSRANIGNDELGKINNYGIVEIAQTKEQIVDKLETLIDRNLAKWDDIYYLRGVVISRIIEIEREIDDVLIEIFDPHDDSKETFRNFLLENSNISLFAKQSILGKIVKHKKKPFSLAELGYLQKSRNMLAHCQRSDNDPTTLVKMGEELSVNKAEIKKIFKKAENFSKCLAVFKTQIRSRSPTPA